MEMITVETTAHFQMSTEQLAKNKEMAVKMAQLLKPIMGPASKAQQARVQKRAKANSPAPAPWQDDQTRMKDCFCPLVGPCRWG